MLPNLLLVMNFRTHANEHGAIRIIIIFIY